jgi:hypothetical protein
VSREEERENVAHSKTNKQKTAEKNNSQSDEWSAERRNRQTIVDSTALRAPLLVTQKTFERRSHEEGSDAN